MWHADLAVISAAAGRAAGVAVDVHVSMHIDSWRVVVRIVPSHQLPAKRGVLLSRPYRPKKIALEMTEPLW